MVVPVTEPRYCPCGNVFMGRGNQKRCKPDCVRDKHSARTDAADRHELEFIGIDGEGVTGWQYAENWNDETQEWETIREETHNYVLLSVGANSLHNDGEILTHGDIFEFLWQNYLDNPKAAFVGFFLGYDFTHWFRTLEAGRAFKLLHKDGIASRQRRDAATTTPRPWPVRVGDWEIDILANKRFMLRPFVPVDRQERYIVNHKDGTAEEKRRPRPWMYVCDSGSFFQTAFLTVINPAKWITPVCTQAEYETIAEGKQRRADAVFDKSMIRYNILENEILSRVMSATNEGLVADNIRLPKHKWFGPGQAAQAWLSLIAAPTGEMIREVVPQYARDAARESYYGGWFEIFAHGLIPKQSFGYDINSAYPFGIASLPCLRHGQWTHGTGIPPKLRRDALRLVDVSVTGADARVGPMPFRRPDGSILRPLKAAGWLWADELEAAKRAGLVKRATVHAWVDYQPCDCPPPLDEIRNLYEGRLQVGKNSPAGKGKKTIYNSAYGKMAQSVGMPKFSNPVYASRITSRCRTMILDAIASHPNKTADLLMVATDSVVFKTPHPTIDLDAERLGAWDETVHENLTLFMPGVYWDDSSRDKVAQGQAPELKSRGISAKDLARMIGHIDEQWSERWTEGIDLSRPEHPRYGWPAMALPVTFQMTTAKQAIVRTAWDTCGQLTHNPRNISSCPYQKRDNGGFGRDARGYFTSYAWPIPYDDKGNELERSTPYDKAFGEDQRENDPDAPIGPDGDDISLIQQAILPR